MRNDLESNKQTPQVGLMEFTKGAFLSTKGSEFVDNWHHKVICEHLEKCLTGEITRLIINMPPRYSQTEVAAISFIAWSLGLFPDSEFLYLSHSESLSNNTLINIKETMCSDYYSDTFGESEFKEGDSYKNELAESKGGKVHGLSVNSRSGGKKAGRGGDKFSGAMVIDNPSPILGVDSKSERDKLNDQVSSIIDFRLNDKSTPVIVIMQRLHEDDLSGFLLDDGNGEEWVHLNIPAINDKGEALWPDKHTIDDLKKMERDRPKIFRAQYLQSPDHE